ncbi:MAG: VTC domain-containing protein [Rikenellaceae bacterium]
MKTISEVISQFEPISLGEMDDVKLMNRCDRKYWFHVGRIEEVLEEVAQDYYVLEVERQRCLPYSTIYYDTARDEMFSSHHRGKMNRYKIRRRRYIATQSSFLEVKFKNNKGRTIKTRHPSDFENVGFDLRDREFLMQNTPYDSNALHQVLENRFRRLMLVSKRMNERCTIDFDMLFMSDDQEAKLRDIVVVEVKTDGRCRSAIIEAMNRLRLKPSGFSKYCVGRSLLHTELKRNLFKSKLRTINNINYGMDRDITLSGY